MLSSVGSFGEDRVMKTGWKSSGGYRIGAAYCGRHDLLCLVFSLSLSYVSLLPHHIHVVWDMKCALFFSFSIVFPHTHTHTKAA